MAALCGCSMRPFVPLFSPVLHHFVQIAVHVAQAERIRRPGIHGDDLPALSLYEANAGASSRRRQTRLASSCRPGKRIPIHSVGSR